MKKLITLAALFILGSNCTFGQFNSKMNFSLQKQLSSARQADYEIAVFIRGDVAQIKSLTESLGGVFKYAAGDIAAVRIALSKIPQLAASGAITRIENNDLRLQPMNNQMVINNHVQEVQLGFGLPQGYDGEGVVMGIIDEGIDFTHPDFRDVNGNTRIKFLWDQSIVNTDTATQAQPYGYGKEYIGSQIDTSSQHVDRPPFMHGTHVAGIASGNGMAVNNFKGVAPKADLIIIKINFNQSESSFLSSLVDGIKYIFDRADELGEPAVINLSLGTYFGSHDGKDIQAQAIDQLVIQKPGRSIVCSAGNIGGAPFHLGYDVAPDTSFTWFQLGSNSIYFQAWGDSGAFENANYTVGIERVYPDHSYIAGLNFQNVLTHPGILQTDTVRAGGNQYGIIYSLAQFVNGSYSVEFEIFPDSVRNVSGPDSSVYFWRFMTKGSGRLDLYSFDMVFDNLPDSASYPFITKYKRPDLFQNICSSFTCSDKLITVGSYTNRNFYTNVNYAIVRDTALHVGALSGFSSHGPTRDGRIKPDIIATGEWVLSTGVQNQLNYMSATEPDKVAAGKKHFRSSGTSMSSPVVAGVAALYFQKNPTATWQDVKEAILNCADRDGFTGNALPDNYWGYGKVNAYNVVKGCSVGIDELDQYAGIDFGNYPNPASSLTTLHYDLSSVTKYNKAELIITDMIGSELRKIRLNEKAGTIDLEKNSLSPGIYPCSLLLDGKVVKVNKMVIL